MGDDFVDGLEEDLVAVLAFGVGSGVGEVDLADLEVLDWAEAVEDVTVFDVEEVVGEDGEEEEGEEEILGHK